MVAANAAAQPAAPPANAPVEQPRYELQGTQLVAVSPDGSRHPVELGCTGRSFLVHETRVYVACGAGGVVVLEPTADGSARSVERIALDGEVTGLFVHDGRLWAQLQRVEARPISAAPRGTTPGPPAAPPVPGPPPVAPPQPGLQPPSGPRPVPMPRTPFPRPGRVVSSEPGEVIVDLGSLDGLTMGMRLRLSLQRNREMDAGHVTAVEEKLAVGEVFEVAPDRARVQLGLNEDVPSGATAQPTRDPLTRSLVAPPRPNGQWHLGLHARPFLALEDLAFGMLSQVEVGYRGEAEWHVRALAEPLGFTAGKDAGLGAVSAVAAASYDHWLFEIGAGVGATRVAESQSPGEGPRMAFTIMPLVRLGALDGLHLDVHNGFVIVEDKFRYGSTTGTIQIPLARPVALQLRGGGGISGYAFGEVGLRVLAAGNGGEGTVFINPSLGAAFMFGDHDCTATYCQSKSYGGPMAGLGLEWRP